MMQKRLRKNPTKDVCLAVVLSLSDSPGSRDFFDFINASNASKPLN